MKSLCLSLFFVGGSVFAQSVDVKDVKTGEADSTTIEIRKGKAEDAKKCEILWDVQEGSADVMGEAASMNREAKSNWKSACTEWKTEFRGDNKENKIISLNCGVPSCSGETGTKSCVSKASYKIKTRLN